MTWTVAITVLIGIILKMAMSPPSIVVGWLVSKFALHPKLHSENVTVTFNGKQLEDEEKIRFTAYFNEATLLEKHFIFPGNEHLFLQPETDVTPFVITVKNGKKDVNFFVYNYVDRVDVVKQSNKKVESYSLRSNHLQTFTLSTKVNVIKSYMYN
ncbi:YfmQ family protein [Bacillus sp. B15-48]|uniref:YfmQ family protein n=1 Tax=Bacillus sp. B15-48 TaxID=1548601 RepID=UPI00193ED7DD|nr:YfmQ family protein [Bacillus sp. B15-48]MBM4763202.1 hypothetical protein [Bacillus sp. B15-48]